MEKQYNFFKDLQEIALGITEVCNRYVEDGKSEQVVATALMCQLAGALANCNDEELDSAIDKLMAITKSIKNQMGAS